MCFGGTVFNEKSLNIAYSYLLIISGAIVDVFLLVQVFMIAKVLDLGITTFRQQKCRIISVMSSFLVTYALYNVWHIVDVKIGNDYAFWVILLGDLFFPALCNYVPIMLVLYTHFKNITSL